MTIGTTTGKEPDYIDDCDLRTPDQLRGDMKTIRDAALSVAERGTIAGVLSEMEALKKMRAEDNEQMNRLVRLYETLRLEFDQFKAQRVKELNLRVNTGSTTPGD